MKPFDLGTSIFGKIQEYYGTILPELNHQNVNTIASGIYSILYNQYSKCSRILEV